MGMSDGGGSRGKVRRVVVVAYPRVNILDVAGPCEVFSSLGEALERSDVVGGYSVEVVSTTRAPQLRTSGGLGLVADRHVEDVRGAVDTLIVAGGAGVWEAA